MRTFNTLAKGLIFSLVCSFGAVILLAHEFSHGYLSSRQFQFATLILGLCMGVWAVLAIKKSAKEFGKTPESAMIPLDEATRKRRRMSIRLGQVSIVILAVLLVTRLRGIGSDPFWPWLVTVAINLLIMASLVWWVVCRKRKRRWTRISR